MYNRDLKKQGQVFGLKEGGGVGYGVIEGMGVSLSDSMNDRVLNVYVGKREDAWPDLNLALSKPAGKYGIRQLKSFPETGVVEVAFFKTFFMKKRMLEFIQTELPKFKGMGFSGASKCAHCGQPLSEKDAAWVLAKPENAALPMHGLCVSEHERHLSERTIIEKNERRSVVLPAVGALLGGIVGMIPFVLLYMFGYFASLAGVFIAIAANFGHKLFGGKPGKGRIFWVILTSVIMVPVALALGEIASIGQMILDGSLAESWGYATNVFTLKDLFPLIQSMWETPEVRAEMLPTLIKNLGMGYVFSLLGCVSAYSSFLKNDNRKTHAKVVRL